LKNQPETQDVVLKTTSTISLPFKYCNSNQTKNPGQEPDEAFMKDFY
jgi:hypothetical protein